MLGGVEGWCLLGGLGGRLWVDLRGRGAGFGWKVDMDLRVRSRRVVGGSEFSTDGGFWGLLEWLGLKFFVFDVPGSRFAGRRWATWRF